MVQAILGLRLEPSKLSENCALADAPMSMGQSAAGNVRFLILVIIFIVRFVELLCFRSFVWNGQTRSYTLLIAILPILVFKLLSLFGSTVPSVLVMVRRGRDPGSNLFHLFPELGDVLADTCLHGAYQNAFQPLLKQTQAV
jgi:uncharacterized membrane protein YhaH (DUF805 family)